MSFLMRLLIIKDLVVLVVTGLKLIHGRLKRKLFCCLFNLAGEKKGI